MAENKTKATGVSVDAFLDSVPDTQRREDSKALRKTMERLSGHEARMWGPSIVGFGRYRYQYESGHKGEFARIGFSPRARELVLYLVGGFPRHQPLLGRLGKFRTGKSCLYVKRLGDVDQAVLDELIG